MSRNKTDWTNSKERLDFENDLKRYRKDKQKRSCIDILPRAIGLCWYYCGYGFWFHTLFNGDGRCRISNEINGRGFKWKENKDK